MIGHYACVVGVGIAPTQGRNRWWRRGFYVAVAIAILVSVGIFVDRVVIGPPPPPGGSAAHRLKPIPVSAAACAHVPELHDAAAQLRSEMDYAVAGLAIPTSSTSWRR